MLKKLLKYDIKALFNILIPVYGILIFLSIFNRLAYYISDKISILTIPAAFITMLYVIVLISVPVATFIISIIRYYKNLVGDEGYLMHTIPVKKSELVLSKLISYFISMIVSCFVSLIGLFIGEYLIYFPKETFTKLLDYIKTFDFSFIVLMALTIIVALILQQLIIYAAIVLGQKQNNNKIIYSVGFGIGLYNVNQIISAIILLTPMLFNKELYKYFNNDILPINIINNFLGASIILSSIFVIGYYILTVKVLEKSLNLE